MRLTIVRQNPTYGIKMAKREMTERITIRLPKNIVTEIDNLVTIGECNNRSEVLRDAVKFFLDEKISKVVENFSTRERFHTIVSQTIENDKEEKEYLKQ